MNSEKQIIIFASDLHRGGVAYSACIMAKAFSASYRVLLVCYEGDAVSKWDVGNSEIVSLHCPYSRTSQTSLLKQNIVRIFRYPYIFIAYYRFKKLFSHSSSSVVISMTLAPMLVAAILKIVSGKKFKLISSERQDPGLDLNSNFVKHLVRKIYEKTDILHVNSPGLANVVVKEFFISQDKVRLIGNVVVQNLEDSASSLRTRKLHVGDRLKLVFIGRLSDQKSVHMLPYFVRAFKNLGFVCSLDIYGDGQSLSSIKNIACDLSVEEDITYHGNVFNASKYICLYDVGLAISAWESFGNTLGEFLSAQIPTICSATRCGLVNWLEDDEVTLIDVAPEASSSEYILEEFANMSVSLFLKNTYTVDKIRDMTYKGKLKMEKFSFENHQYQLLKLLD